ncbi:MAG: hypothetical protein WA192_06935 [Candidatus Acidiferrales bacterium]
MAETERHIEDDGAGLKAALQNPDRAGNFDPELMATLGAWTMEDLVFVAVTFGFFVLAFGYVLGCERLK